MEQAAAAPRERLDALTGIRFFAALAVFLHHTPRPEWLPGPVSRFMGSGMNGVTIFFILSGFVIAFNYFDDAARPTVKATWNYFVGRVARVYPLYIVTLTVVWLTYGEGQWLTRFAWQALALHAWHPDLRMAYGNNAPGWSISVEFFLYACFPIIVLALRPIARNWKAIVAVALGLIALSFTLATLFQLLRPGLGPNDPESAHRWIYRNPGTRLIDFALGMLAALLLRELLIRWGRRPARRDTWLAPMLTWLPIAVTVGLMTWTLRTRYYASFDAMWIVPSLALLIGLGYYHRSSLSRLLSRRSLVFLGEVSFAFYLVHRPIQNLFRTETFVDDSPVLFTLKTLGIVLVVTAVAAACHFVIERPAQRWINRLLKVRTRPSAAPSVPAQRTPQPVSAPPAPAPTGR